MCHAFSPRDEHGPSTARRAQSRQLIDAQRCILIVPSTASTRDTPWLASPPPLSFPWTCGGKAQLQSARSAMTDAGSSPRAWMQSRHGAPLTARPSRPAHKGMIWLRRAHLISQENVILPKRSHFSNSATFNDPIYFSFTAG